MIFLKKFGTNKRNPNPPWPNEQAVVMIPSGSSADAVGLSGQKVYDMQNGQNMNAMSKQEWQNNTGSDREEMMNGMNGTSGVRDRENYQIMGEMQRPTDRILQNRAFDEMMVMPNNMQMWQGGESMMQQSGGCESTYITGYLCGHTGRYIRMEFLFGEQTHVEKTGILREVGRNYIVMQEMGTENMIVCPLDKIKFINIYNVNNNNQINR